MAAEVSGLDEKTAISANFTITPEKIEKLKNYLIACSRHAFTNSESNFFLFVFFQRRCKVSFFVKINSYTYIHFLIAIEEFYLALKENKKKLVDS